MQPHFVPAPLRRDLVITHQTYLGRPYVVIKNPIGLSYFRLPAAHAEAARAFDGKTSFADILASLRTTSRYWRSKSADAALKEIHALAQQLGASGLLRVQGVSAVARSDRIKDAKHKRRFELLIAKVLYFRKSLFDPDLLLERMLPWFDWMFSRTFVVLSSLFFAATLFMAFREWDELSARAANFFTFENLALTWVLFFGVKVVHEFGHGIATKKFGGEVHEMGAMFILFTPYLFCNVSDSWRAPRNARIAITAAGIYVELLLAAIATWLWLFSSPGLFNQMCFNTMFLCSISTVIFNANPLLKFDGYYILSDVLEIPNLKQKSSIYITEWAQRNLLGIRNLPQRLAPFERNPWFGFYAVASYAYGWFILFNISHFLFDALKPYGLEVLSRTYVALFLFTSLGLPLYRLFNSIKAMPGALDAMKPRLRLIGLASVAAVVALFLIPWDDTIKRTVIIEHARLEPVAPKDDAFLRELAVTDGQSVRKGDLIAVLEDTDLTSQLTDLKLQLDAAELRYRAAITSPRAADQQAASAFQKMANELNEQITGVEQKLASLRLTAPLDGVVRTWNVSRRHGRYFRDGEPVCEVGSPGALRAVVALSEREARRVQPGQHVRFRLYAEPGREFTGTITAPPVAPVAQMTSPALANLFGGDVPADPDPDPKIKARPSLPHYEAEVAITTPDPILRPGMLGKARITTGQATLGQWLVERTLDIVDPEIRL